MDTGELCHGFKKGRSFQVLATVQEKSMVMLGVLSMLCPAAGLRNEDFTSPQTQHSFPPLFLPDQPEKADI